MTTATRPRRTKRKARKALPKTLGPYVCAWIEENLVHGEGDYQGNPFLLRDWQRAFIYRVYELKTDGSRRYLRVLWGMPSGNGKTEIAAALACAELDGPVVCDRLDEQGQPIAKRRISPNIPVAAASFEQADLVFGAARLMLGDGPLAERFDIYDTEITIRGRAGRMYRVAAKAGTNDGGRPTMFVADELHEWVCTCAAPGGVHRGPCKARVHTVLSKLRAKREGSWELNISTAGWQLESLLGGLYHYGKDVEAGRIKDDGFLFEWHSPKAEEVKLDDRRALKKAVVEANPAIGDFLSLENVLTDFRTMAPFEARRYHLNQWVTAPDRWLPEGAWEALEDGGKPEDGTEIVIGFDGSWAGDSTAVYGATVEAKPHLFMIGSWEREPEDSPDWRVDIVDVENTIEKAGKKWQVKQIGCDPYRWQRSMAALRELGLPVEEWPSHQASRMVPACKQFFDAVVDEKLTQDGNENAARHLANCVVKIDSRGPRIVKEREGSPRKIDIAVTAVIVYDLAMRSLKTGSWRVIK